ncbi:DUF4123 domain-containing protein [Pantoea sp. BIGb0393]|uniref:DUF4123 domain-containing protein n=1 Tax=Pantoea nemavictus TaxID=2726955 RepID=A0ABU8PWK7_9GAMM|nr:DUF4123 domain-containing protein [Pantoea nemavictus]MBA0037512.1 DUF4123 domain-containing protein [Pantoea nemavictus]
MTNKDNGKAWLKQATALCTAAGQDYIDVLVDQAGSVQPLQQALNQITPPLRWFALFEGTPEAATAEYSPLVMRLHWSAGSHQRWLEQLVEHFTGSPRLTLLLSPLAFDLLSSHLQALSQVHWEEQTGLLRYYDNRVFSSLLEHVQPPEQQATFTDIALFWSWRDRDGELVWKTGTWHPERQLTDAPAMNRISDAQVELMGCISDAEALMKERATTFGSREADFAHCFAIALKASREGYVGDLMDYKE